MLFLSTNFIKKMEKVWNYVQNIFVFLYVYLNFIMLVYVTDAIWDAAVKFLTQICRKFAFDAKELVVSPHIHKEPI